MMAEDSCGLALLDFYDLWRLMSYAVALGYLIREFPLLDDINPINGQIKVCIIHYLGSGR